MRLFVFDSILMKTFSCCSFAFDTHAHSYHQCDCVESRSEVRDERFRRSAAQRPAVFLVHIHDGLRQPARQTGMQLHTGTYARLLATASPLPSLRFLRQWYSLREEMRR